MFDQHKEGLRLSCLGHRGGGAYDQVELSPRIAESPTLRDPIKALRRQVDIRVQLLKRMRGKVRQTACQVRLQREKLA